jgi:hypothetical protein
VNPACVASNLLAEVMEGAIDMQEAAAAIGSCNAIAPGTRRRPSPPIRRRQRDAKRSSSSSSRLSLATRSADAHRRDRDDAYRTAKKKQDSDERDRARRNMTRKSISGASRTRPHGTDVQDNRKPTLEKLETAEYDEAEVARRRDIQRQREEARREIWTRW